MTIPRCKCGHSAFGHVETRHGCIADKCLCVGFDPAPANFPAQPTVWPDADERRRYALLQAAAVIYAANDQDPERDPLPVTYPIDAAERLLAEIEHREIAKEAR